MTWIRTIHHDEATGELKSFYDEQHEFFGHESNFHDAISLKPKSLIALRALIKTIGGGASSLGRRKEELIATTVSALSGNRYCTYGHGERLRILAGQLADAVKADWRKAELGADEYAMLEFCEKVTLNRRHVTEQDIVQLRSSGFDDVQILEIVLAIALRHFCNVVGDALGVEPHFELDKPRA